ncbi:CdaR family protein [Sphingobacterium psychroaquaticum]|uniref:YbbR domain-containing protein n=1 Tax=Sphingobacterium psychroaquaticum TaxID=561061 RepID=A0A1X7KUV1_9SPHI|nr:hypothetical protein [Sphingobacterium psychroaquaticum]QBQ40679.1 hypothetical protein E2P86_05745 [Sphingobacterium psychroaquaticum]SMG45060.1 YbbR domain-containing protein [Sphingobacterium psychroaquaticum]
MAQPRISKVKRRKLAIFLRCIVISFFAWLLFAISSIQTYTIKAGISYVNIPEQKAFHPLQSDTVSVRMKMSGWKIFLKKLYPDTPHVQVDLSGLKTKSFIVFTNQLGYINRQFPADNQVVSVSPDTLFFDFSKQTQRKVPVRALYSMQFKKQYGIIGDTKANPDYVTVTGPLEDVANIEYLETDTIRGTAVSSDIRTIAYLNKHQKNNITIYPTFSEITIPVGEITEKVLELPIRVENGGRYTTVRTIPTKVKVTFLVSLKDYNKWTSRDFEAIVDMENWEENKVKTLPVIITKVPNYCQIISIEPQNIDFFVRK